MKKLYLCLLSCIVVILCGCNTGNTNDSGSTNDANNTNNEQELRFKFEMKEKCSQYDTEKLREELSESIAGIEMYNIFYSEKYNSCLAYYNGDSHFEGMYETAGFSMAPFDIITDIFSKKQLFKCGYFSVSKSYYVSNKDKVLFLNYDKQFYENNDTFNNDCKLIADDFISNIE